MIELFDMFIKCLPHISSRDFASWYIPSPYKDGRAALNRFSLRCGFTEQDSGHDLATHMEIQPKGNLTLYHLASLHSITCLCKLRIHAR